MFEYTIEFFFVLDVLIHFNTTLYDSDGNEIFDRKHIAIDYLCELHFWIDMAATIPLGVIIPQIVLTLYRAIQLLSLHLL